MIKTIKDIIEFLVIMYVCLSVVILCLITISSMILTTVHFIVEGQIALVTTPALQIMLYISSPALIIMLIFAILVVCGIIKEAEEADPCKMHAEEYCKEYCRR